MIVKTESNFDHEWEGVIKLGGFSLIASVVCLVIFVATVFVFQLELPPRDCGGGYHDLFTLPRHGRGYVGYLFDRVDPDGGLATVGRCKTLPGGQSCLIKPVWCAPCSTGWQGSNFYS